MPVVNMTGVEDFKGFEAIPKGVYEVQVTDYENRVGQNSGDEYVAVTVKIVDDSVDEELVGRKLWRNVSLSPKSLPYLRNFLLSFGADEDEIASQFDTDDILDELIGNEATALAVVSVKKFKDEAGDIKLQNEIKSFKPVAA